ncbi:MAG: preprotein translocase subunit SecA [Gemmataceae bacterium]|nr:preprotein translocase subunit SecA [Gemmataceae bacterium]MDW8264086.1 preprotein translocase subunit SecA [Gemmataceae bacterium]
MSTVIEPLSPTPPPTHPSHFPGTAPEPARPNIPGRLGPEWLNRLKVAIGLPSQRRLARAALLVPVIRHWEKEFSRLSDEELRKRGLQLRGRARAGQSLDSLLPEAFGLVCVAAQRTIGLRPFDVQLAGAVVLHHGALAELATGEGKTLTAALPAFLNALPGRGVHITTVNDYLAKRDAEWIGPIYNALGLTVGVLQMKMPEHERYQAYRCDITYGTASEFGFDFLRDRIKVAGEKGQASPFWMPWDANGYSRPLDPRVQREHYFALVDEADCIFIDEASTPLIIGEPTRWLKEEEQVVYLWADRVARSLVRDEHFILDEKKQKIELTDAGKHKVRWSNPPAGPHSHAMDKLHEHVERALHAHHRFRRDQHYMVEFDDVFQKHKVCIIDEYTGRKMPDRHWQDGLHQAVEAKEGVPITKATEHAAQITYQTYFRLYKKLSGMTGTAYQNWWEIRRVYKIWVVCVPTNRPVIREHWPEKIFPTEDAKFAAITEDVAKLQAAGRPVLVGTRSVEKSEKLSELFRQRGIVHQMLNGKQPEPEALVVDRAGERGRVTIATNMAGRGTDIKLGPGVRELGGLHVIGTEIHSARRIDRQLAGRAARQGDPGSCQFYLSLEDEILEALGEDKQRQLLQLARSGANLDWQKFRPLFFKAQRRSERRLRRQRVDLMLYERHRQEILKDLGADPYVD